MYVSDSAQNEDMWGGMYVYKKIVHLSIGYLVISVIDWYISTRGMYDPLGCDSTLMDRG